MEWQDEIYLLATSAPSTLAQRRGQIGWRVRLELSNFVWGPVILITHSSRLCFQRTNQVTGITAAALPPTQMRGCGPLSLAYDPQAASHIQEITGSFLSDDHPMGTPPSRRTTSTRPGREEEEGPGAEPRLLLPGRGVPRTLQSHHHL